MEIFLDTVSPQAVAKYKHLISGVTTNPGLMANAGVEQEATLLEIAKIAPTLPLSGEVIYANSVEQVCEDAKKIASMAPNMVVKIPGNIIGLSSIRILKAEGLQLNVTALMTFKQLALASQLGADYVSQFFCRARDASLHSVREINMAREFIEQNNLPTKIIIGSIRSVEDVETAMLSRGHIITINPNLLEQSFSHSKTDFSIEEFAKRYEESVKKRGIQILAPKPIQSINFKNMEKQKAVIWDRDGVLNHVVAERSDGEKNVSPQKFEDFKLVEGVAEVLQATRLLGYLNIIATKQPDISRNKMSWEDLNRMHDFLKAHVPTIEAIYVCPHDRKDNCNCRKPKPGSLLEAAKDYNLDLAQCYMVGDSQSDIDAGKAAGTKTILVKTHYNTEVTGQDFEISNLKEILDII